MSRPAIEITFWGTRGSIATPGPATARYGGNTSCVEVRLADRLLVIDAGTGARPLGADLLRRAAGRPIDAHVLISHTHWDHIQGLPFFVPAFVKQNRFEIVGPTGIDVTLERVIKGQMDPHYFPVEMTEMAATFAFRELVAGPFAIGDITVRTQYLHHTSIALGYRLELGGRSVVYATDHELHRRMYEVRGDPPTMLAAADRHDAEFQAFIEGADVYIADAQYQASEYPARRGWGHSTIEDVAALAARAGVGRLVVFHHDPMRSDDDLDAHIALGRRILAEHGSRVECLAAREGDTLLV